ncbi:germination protein KC [Sporosarcina luteola]|uniref:Germination protein KC n=1 Tax=Sporosarcina luteola TaxID=582850 RepID=A0A511Z5B5_9BACL|nr:Ger(x)C family spore germination protein [Sporosarcina luteola]GEN82643.1 germination protein KC [Sporosarcina luteola]
MKKGLLIIIMMLLLGGCWDEAQYKDVTIVPVMGIEKDGEEIKTIFSFPTFENGMINYSTSEGKGFSTWNARYDANQRTMEALNLAHLEVLLVSDNLAKKDIYEPLDMFFRTPKNRITSYIAIIEGDMEQYFNLPEDVNTDVADFYPELLHTAVLYTFVAENTLGETAKILREESMDLSLPYMTLNEKGIPTVEGIALFSNYKFTGKTLRKEESIAANIMKDNLGKHTYLTYKWRQKESPITIEIISVHRKIKITHDKIDLNYVIDIGVDEFPKNGLYKNDMRRETENFLSDEMKRDFNKVIQKTQEAKSDIFGFGRRVHAFHSELWERGDWQETYATFPIEVDVKVRMKRTNILD